MKKTHAFLVALIICISLANIAYLSSLNTSKNSMLLSRVIDGDTIVLDNGEHVRLVNINSPEKDVSSSIFAADYLKKYENKTIYIENLGTDKYKRTLAKIYDQNGNYLNLALVKEGLASKFLVQDSELSTFAKAETKAIEEQKGIWTHSIYYGCLTSEIDKYAEIIEIINKCPQINFDKFTLKDESRKIFTFPDISFDKIIIHSGKGESNSTDLFWAQSTDVWNNDRDTVYIFDSENKIVHSNPYGY